MILKKHRITKKNIFFLVILFVCLASVRSVYATSVEIPNVELNIGGEEALSSTVQIIIALTILAIAPSILLMMTSFTRILIIFSFVRRALSLQSTPPNQVLVGLSLFLTFFIMSPIFAEIYENAYVPLSQNEISQEEAFEKAIEPMHDFMYKQVRKSDLSLFIKISEGKPIDPENVSIWALIPAFIISELKTAFIVGFMLFIPFIIVDMVVASTLMALGMMMLPPVMISLPFKILLFIMVDGWNLLTGAIVSGFRI